MKQIAALLAVMVSLFSCATPSRAPATSPPGDRLSEAIYSMRLGDASTEAQDYPAAAERYRYAIVLMPDGPAYDGWRAPALTGLGTTSSDNSEAVLAFTLALAIVERQQAPAEARAEIMMGLGARLRQAGRCGEAKRVLEDAIGLYKRQSRPPVSGLLLNLGNTNFDCGDLSEARTLYELALSTSHERWLRASALRGLASVDLANGNLERARVEIEEAMAENELEVGPEHPNLVRQLDLQRCILHLSGREGEARNAASRADAIAARNPQWFPDRQSRALSRRLTSACS